MTLDGESAGSRTRVQAGRGQIWRGREGGGEWFSAGARETVVSSHWQAREKCGELETTVIRDVARERSISERERANRRVGIVSTRTCHGSLEEAALASGARLSAPEFQVHAAV